MNFNKEISQFVTGIIIINDEGIIVSADDFFEENIVGLKAENCLKWVKRGPELELGKSIEWEYMSKDNNLSYRIKSGKIEKEGKIYSVHQVMDVSDYFGLTSEIVEYMDFFRKMSEFQKMVLGKLNVTYYELLPVVVDFLKTSCAYSMVEHGGYLDIKYYNSRNKEFINDRIEIEGKVKGLFAELQNEKIDKGDFLQIINNEYEIDRHLNRICMGSVNNQKYAVFVDASADEEEHFDSGILEVIKLYMENGIMREKLEYDAFHDGLTGLCNKAHYLERSNSLYRNLDSIAIFNLDVNDLKKTNDNLGHEAGDKLLIKAADSIRKVTSDKVQGYRMGGDEYLIVACNVTEDEANKIKEKWENTLAKLNTLDDGIKCVIAIGMVYAEGPYDYDELMTRADALMYEDKRAKKAPGEEIR